MVNQTLQLSRTTRPLDQPISFQNLVEQAPNHDHTGAARLRRGSQ